MSLRDLVVGDSIMTHDLNLGTRKLKVTRVGRKYLYVGRQRFDRETGRVADEFGHAHAYSLSEWGVLSTYRETRHLLLLFGVRLDPKIDHLTTKIYEALKPLIEGEK